MVLHCFQVRGSFAVQAGVIFLFLLLMVTSSRADGDIENGQLYLSALSSGGNEAEVESAEDDVWEEEIWGDDWDAPETIADPLEPLNRLFFHFNDKLYYWVLKPVARVYSGFFPEELQIAVRNFFDNLRSPARAVNCLLQMRLRDSSGEVVRFALNSTIGILGIGDFARDALDLRSSKEDFGQTLAFYGAGGIIYINWPILGPSNVRDSVGMVGDAYLHPMFLLDAERELIIAAWTFEKVNYTALTLGDYELFTETALDPYAAVRDAYQQYRNGLIRNQ